MKKDNRYNNYFDNYSNRAKQSLITGFVLVAIIGVIYFINSLLQ